MMVRLSATEYADGGYSIDDIVTLSQALEAAGVIAIDLSGGTNETPELSRYCIQPPSFPRRFLEPYARPIKDAVTVPVIMAGRMLTPEDAEGVLQAGSADYIALCRALVADPHWCLKAFGEVKQPIRHCISCNVCFEAADTGARCRPLRATRWLAPNSRRSKGSSRGSTGSSRGTAACSSSAAASRDWKPRARLRNQRPSGRGVGAHATRGRRPDGPWHLRRRTRTTSRGCGPTQGSRRWNNSTVPDPDRHRADRRAHPRLYAGLDHDRDRRHARATPRYVNTNIPMIEAMGRAAPAGADPRRLQRHGGRRRHGRDRDRRVHRQARRPRRHPRSSKQLSRRRMARSSRWDVLLRLRDAGGERSAAGAPVVSIEDDAILCRNGQDIVPPPRGRQDRARDPARDRCARLRCLPARAGVPWVMAGDCSNTSRRFPRRDRDASMIAWAAEAKFPAAPGKTHETSETHETS